MNNCAPSLLDEDAFGVRITTKCFVTSLARGRVLF